MKLLILFFVINILSFTTKYHSTILQSFDTIIHLYDKQPDILPDIFEQVLGHLL